MSIQHGGDLDVDGRVLAANGLIEDLSSHHVWMPRDRIALIEPAADKLLRGAIADLGNPAATSVRSFPSKGTGERPVVMHLIPVTGNARDLFRRRIGRADDHASYAASGVGRRAGAKPLRSVDSDRGARRGDSSRRD